jgi:SH3-like domain-containing protein
VIITADVPAVSPLPQEAYDRNFASIAKVLDYLLVSQEQQVQHIKPDAPITINKLSYNQSDLRIVKVTVHKANLRAGPGFEHSPLMIVSKDSRLVVESKQGDWYRIITPTGSRAWIYSDIVSLG